MLWANLTPSGTSLTLDAFDLGGAFAIPLDKHLIINDIIFTIGAGQGELRMLWDFNTDGRTVNEITRNAISLVANSQGDELHHLRGIDVDIFAELIFTGSNMDFEISFGYSFGDGAMNYGQAIADVLQDMRVIGEPEIAPGSEFYQAGDTYVILGVGS